MGFRLDAGHNVVPAYVKEHKLICDYLPQQIIIDLPDDICDFELQHTQIGNSAIMCYLQQGDFELVLRFDGTGCYVQNGYLRRSFRFSMKSSRLYLREKGSLTVDGKSFILQHIMLNNGDAIMFTPAWPSTWLLKDFSKREFDKFKTQVRPLFYLNNKRELVDENGVLVENVIQWSSYGFKNIGGA